MQAFNQKADCKNCNYPIWEWKHSMRTVCPIKTVQIIYTSNAYDKLFTRMNYLQKLCTEHS